MNIDTAIQHLRLTIDLQVPHGISPGSYPGGFNGEFTEAEWNAYQWNPNPMFPDLETDTDASPKPTWQELITANETSQYKGLRAELLSRIRIVCRQRIVEAYGQDNHHDEIELRLGGRHTEAQDTERERLRSRYSIIKSWIESTDRTLAELEALDLNDDANWTGTEWPPTRNNL